MSSTENALAPISEPTPEKGLPTKIQQALYAAILPKLDTCRRFMHYGLSLEGTGKEKDLRDALAMLVELEAGYQAGNESDLNSLVAMVTLMEAELPKMEVMLNQQNRTVSTTQVVVSRTITLTTTSHRQRKKGLWDKFFDLDWLP